MLFEFLPTKEKIKKHVEPFFFLAKQGLHIISYELNLHKVGYTWS